MARFLPRGVAGLIFLAALGASVSTSSTAILGAVSTASRDVYQRIFNPRATSCQILIASRILTLVFGLAVLALCFYPGGPIFLFAFGFAFMVPPGLILFIAMAWCRLTPTAGFLSMLVGMISIIVWQLTPSLMKLGHQVWIGLVLTPPLGILPSYVTKRKYYSEASRTLNPARATGSDIGSAIRLTEQDLQLLEAIRTGWNTMVELIDFLGADAKVISDLSERLDKNRYIVRHGFVGSKFYTFGFTYKGMQVLPQLSEEEMELARAGLRPRDVKVLKTAGENPDLVNERLAAILNMDPEELNPVIIHLLRLGYLTHSGIWRRRIYATAKAHAVIAARIPHKERPRSVPAGKAV